MNSGWRGSRQQGLIVFIRQYVPDLYNPDRPLVDYVVICDAAYERYLDPETEPVQGSEEEFERRRRVYEQLLSKPAVWEYRPKVPTKAFADPVIRVVKVR